MIFLLFRITECPSRLLYHDILDPPCIRRNPTFSAQFYPHSARSNVNNTHVKVLITVAVYSAESNNQVLTRIYIFISAIIRRLIDQKINSSK